VKNACRYARDLNVQDDTYLNALADRIEKDLVFEPMFLRTLPEEREHLVNRAKSIADDLAAFM
jgi:hypothetical protein